MYFVLVMLCSQHYLFLFDYRFSINDDNSLLIKKISIEDSAIFQCHAVNDVGEETAHTWIKVKS